MVYSKMQLKHLKHADEARAAALEAQSAADRSSLVLKTTQAVHGITLGIAAHRLNGPLHVSNAVVSDLAQSAVFESHAETVNGLKAALRDMQAHLNEVLQLERFWRLTRKSSARPADVSAVVEEMERLVSATMKAGIQTKVDTRLPNTVVLDPTLLLLSMRTGMSALNDIGAVQASGVVIRVQRVWAPALAPQAGAPTELVTDSSWLRDYVPENMASFLELENLGGPRGDTALEWIHLEIRAKLQGAEDCSGQSAQRLIENSSWQSSREWLSTMLKGTRQHLAICCLVAAAQGGRVGLVANTEDGNCTGRFFLQLPLVITSERSTNVHRLAEQLMHLPLSSSPLAPTPTSLPADPGLTEITPITDDPQLELAGSIEPASATGNTQRPLHVLVVDDESSVRKVHQRFLTKLGYTSEMAADGHEAVQRVLSSPPGTPGFDLIMMDIVMPRMSGVEACRDLRDHGITIPIVAVTANAGMHDRASYVTAGFSSVLAKPFSVSQLGASIAEAVDEHEP
jgi:CheY-like chemotaxis protein